MSNEKTPAVGIDLGTTFSAIARLDHAGRPTTLPNAEGDLTTPSAVFFDGNEVIVGKEAIKALSTDADRVALSPKRDMGARRCAVPVNQQFWVPEVLQAYILRKLIADARAQVGDFSQAVITVPAYFDEVRRKATFDAAYMAGIELLDIINEPTAAALAFGYQQGFLSVTGESGAKQTVLVYDLGGGTFDVTLVELDGKSFKTLAIDGDVRLGGRDWDQRVINWAAEQFDLQHRTDPREDPIALGRLWRECEDAKRTLTARKKVTLNYEHQGKAIKLELSREKFDELTHDLLDRTNFTTRQVLRAVNRDWSSVDRLLLVGGSTRMPMIGDMLRQLSGKEPDASVSADEVVAHGAALRAGLILAEKSGQPARLTLQDVNSHSLGVVGTDPHTMLPRNVILIPRNTLLPAKAKRVFRTQQANQKNIRVQIIEGESATPDGCTSIGECVVRDLPANLPAGSPIEVAFAYRPDGRLSARVTVGDSKQPLMHELKRNNGLTREELDQWRTKITAQDQE